MASKSITIADDESVISLLPSASASVLAKLPGLWGGGARELDTNEIRNCLHEVEEEVNLWQL